MRTIVWRVQFAPCRGDCSRSAPWHAICSFLLPRIAAINVSGGLVSSAVHSSFVYWYLCACAWHACGTWVDCAAACLLLMPVFGGSPMQTCGAVVWIACGCEHIPFWLARPWPVQLAESCAHYCAAAVQFGFSVCGVMHASVCGGCVAQGGGVECTGSRVTNAVACCRMFCQFYLWSA
jgi:hypothetical protein